MTSLNENIAYAKAILNKMGILQGSPEYSDYLKIRELCDKNHGYVGILCRIRFVDKISDMNEIESIFDILKNSKIDISKLTKMTYEDILEIFYDEIKGSDNEKDYKLIFKDSSYSYYRVYTYEGILKIGSPAWCLKTKSHWENYQSKYPFQWVAISNKYVGKLVTPENDYLTEYKSKKHYIRIGISLDSNCSGVAFGDGNNIYKLDLDSHTFYGVYKTICNLQKGIMQSYYNFFTGFKKVENTVWMECVDKKCLIHDFGDIYENYNKVFIRLDKNYSFPVTILALSDALPFLRLYTSNEDHDTKFIALDGDVANIFLSYAVSSSNQIYFGVKLKIGLITKEESEQSSDFVGRFGKWNIYDRNDNYYVAVNMEVKELKIPLTISAKIDMEWNDALFLYVKKDDKSVFGCKKLPKEYSDLVNHIEVLSRKNKKRFRFF